MAIEKKRKVDRVEVTDNGTLQIRERIQLFDGETPLDSCSYHRVSVEPGGKIPEGLTTDFDLKKLAAAVWTETVTSAFKAEQEKLRALAAESRAREKAAAAEQAEEEKRKAEEFDALVDKKVKAALAKAK